MCRVILAMALVLSLAIGGGAAMATASITGLGQSTTSTLAPLNPVPVPVAHVSGMRHDQDKGGTGNVAQQFFCAIACMGLTTAPGVPTPDHTLVNQSLPMTPDFTEASASDQVLLRPTSPPPRILAII
jgi:hypothetical protein